MYTPSNAPQVGDIVSAFLPVHYNPGVPGPTERLCLVLGLEVDEQINQLRGLWLVRLSERLEKVRDWDYLLERTEYTDNNGTHLGQDFVIRTPRIDLLPTDGDFIDDFEVLGRVVPHFWDRFERQLDRGQHCSFTENTYGPREKLPHTIVKTAMDSDVSLPAFDYETIINLVSLPPIARDHVRADSYNLAERQRRSQMSTVSRMLQHDFIASMRGDTPWSPEISAQRGVEYYRKLFGTGRKPTI